MKKENQIPKPLKMDIELALKINKLVHNECKDVPHDIGLRIEELVRLHQSELKNCNKITSEQLPTIKKVIELFDQTNGRTPNSTSGIRKMFSIFDEFTGDTNGGYTSAREIERVRNILSNIYWKFKKGQKIS